jgi:hypothetical protein
MAQAGGQHRLAPEQAHETLVVGQVRRHHLDRADLIQVLMDGSVDRAHSAAADGSLKHVWPELATDQRIDGGPRHLERRPMTPVYRRFRAAASDVEPIVSARACMFSVRESCLAWSLDPPDRPTAPDTGVDARQVNGGRWGNGPVDITVRFQYDRPGLASVPTRTVPMRSLAPSLATTRGPGTLPGGSGEL